MPTNKKLSKVHESSGLEFKFVTDELGSWLITRIKFTKNGAIMIAGQLGYWVAYGLNDGVLSPDMWQGLMLVSTKAETYLAKDEDAPEPLIKFDSSNKTFVIMYDE